MKEESVWRQAMSRGEKGLKSGKMGSVEVD